MARVRGRRHARVSRLTDRQPTRIARGLPAGPVGAGRIRADSAEDGDAGGEAVQEVAAADGSDLARAERAGERHRAEQLLDRARIVIGRRRRTASPASVAREQQRARHRGRRRAGSAGPRRRRRRRGPGTARSCRRRPGRRRRARRSTGRRRARCGRGSRRGRSRACARRRRCRACRPSRIRSRSSSVAACTSSCSRVHRGPARELVDEVALGARDR